MAKHEHTVIVDRPMMTVYDQWTQFESYPSFMDNVVAVEQIGATMTHWKVSVAGVEREYDAQILEQRPTEVIAWQSVSGPTQAGRVTFAAVDADHTRVTLELDFEPHGVTENVGESVGVVSASVEKSLARFKDYIEDRGEAEDGWRGTIADGVPVSGGRAMGETSYGAEPAMGEPVDLRDREGAGIVPGMVEPRDLP